VLQTNKIIQRLSIRRATNLDLTSVNLFATTVRCSKGGSTPIQCSLTHIYIDDTVIGWMVFLQ
jgi:hypothetical protein